MTLLYCASSVDGEKDHKCSIKLRGPSKLVVNPLLTSSVGNSIYNGTIQYFWTGAETA